MARFINPEEAGKLGLRHLGKKHHVRSLIEMMEKEQLLHVTKEDFKWKRRTPLFFCNQISKATAKKFSVMKTVNKNGWVVQRLE